MSIVLFIFILVALILVHELGHFFAAKWSGVKVDEFGIGFPPKLGSVKYGETEYTINLLPFGGFVRIFGENSATEEGTGQKPEKSFANKPRVVQAAIIVAGVLMNLVFAWLLLSIGYMVGLPASSDHAGLGEGSDIKTVIVEVLPRSPAEAAGLLAGDTLTGIGAGEDSVLGGDGAEALRNFIAAHATEELSLEVVRGGEMFSLEATPALGLAEDRPVLGVSLDDIGVLKLLPHEALIEGASLTANLTVRTAEGLYAFFAGILTGAADFSSIAGPVGLVGIVGEASEFGITALITLTAIISINLALINLIPFPALDGGRIVLIGIEAIRRKSISSRFIGLFNMLGFTLLILLMVVVTYHDIARLIGG